MTVEHTEFRRTPHNGTKIKTEILSPGETFILGGLSVNKKDGYIEMGVFTPDELSSTFVKGKRRINQGYLTKNEINDAKIKFKEVKYPDVPSKRIEIEHIYTWRKSKVRDMLRRVSSNFS